MYTTVEHVQPRGNAGIERMQTSYNPNHDNFPAHLQHQHQLQQPLVTGTSYHPSPPPPSSQRSKKRLPLKTRLLIAGEKCMDVLVRFLGPCLSILCVSLIAFITYVYFTEVFPMLNARVCHGATDDALRRYTARGDWSIETLRGRIGILDSRSGRFLPGGDRSRLEQMRAQTAAIEASVELDGCSQTYLITSFGVYLLFNIVFHYFATMLKGPGRPPSTPFGQEVLDHLSQYDPERRDDQNIRFCKPCNQVKPMRAHHCRVCGKCSLKMDHHCPWINNCVGWRNLRHFLSFLFYLWSGTGFFLLASLDGAMGVLLGDSGGGTTFLIATIVVFAAFMAGFLFLCWSGYLMFTNQTTIEFYGNHWGPKTGNHYAQDLRRNIAAVFGEMGIWILLFPSLVEPPGDGIIFPLNAGRGQPLPMLVDERTA